MNKISLLKKTFKWHKKDDSLAPSVPDVSETPLTILQAHSDDKSTVDVNVTAAAAAQTTVEPCFDVDLSTETEDASDNGSAEETGKIISELGTPTPDAIPEFVDDTLAADPVDEVAVIDPVRVVGSGSHVSKSSVEISPVMVLNDYSMKNNGKVVYVLMPNIIKRGSSPFFTIQARYNNNYGYGCGFSKREAKRNAAYDLLDVMKLKHENLNNL